MAFSMDAPPQHVSQITAPVSTGKLQIYDGNNYARKVFATDTSGLGIRRLFVDIYYNPDPCIVIFDGKGAKEERRKIFPEYKAQRPPAPDGFYRVLDFWKELLAHTHAIKIEVPHREADDSIAKIARGTSVPVEIRSTDGDYYALVNELVSAPGTEIAGISPEDVRLYKTLVGDNSDNVKGISKFGPKGFFELTRQTKDEIISFLNGEIEWTSCLKTDRLNNWVTENTPLLKSYWQVVGFLSVSDQSFAQGLSVGSRDLALAESKLDSVNQGVRSTGRSWADMLVAAGMPAQTPGFRSGVPKL